MKLLFTAAILIGCIIAHSLAIAAPAATPEVMLFSFFRDNGKDGVFLATSDDGTEFKALNNDNPVFTPPNWPGQNLTRDPSIVYHDGTFHMVWTSQLDRPDLRLCFFRKPRSLVQTRASPAIPQLSGKRRPTRQHLGTGNPPRPD